MAISIQDLLDDVAAFKAADDAHADAREATNRATANTASVTAVEQALIDQANAHFDAETRTAQASEAAAVAAEGSASDAEEFAKSKLIADIQAYAAQK